VLLSLAFRLLEGGGTAQIFKLEGNDMSLRDAYRQKLEAQLEEEVARLNLLKAKAKKAVADGRIIAYEELATADQRIAAARSKLKEFGHASEGAWQEMKGGLDHAWRDLNEACKKASAKFGGKE
jgi:predicted kinase